MRTYLENFENYPNYVGTSYFGMRQGTEWDK